MEFQQPQAERRRIDPVHTASGSAWPSGGPPLRHVQPQSILSDFVGTGVSNNNGNFTVGGNLYFNHGTTADTASTPLVGRKDILKSLRFEQIESRQLSIKKAHENTCVWFLTAPIYQQWEEKAKLQEKENLLWIKGKPGAGKSTLMNYLDKQLRSRLRKDEGPYAFISFFFNARGSDLERSIEGMYRSLLLQLLEARPELQIVLDRLVSVPEWDISLLRHLFEQAAEISKTIICLIDALDECREDDIRDMVRSFESILQAGGQLHVCFASRHYPHISTRLGLSITLEDQDQHENDISSYLNTKLNIGHSEQAEKIRMEIREKASGVFMWVVLVVEMLNKEYDKGKIPNLRKRLRQLPGDLHELFHSILVRDNEDRDELLLCIQWVLFTKRPLTPKELYFAILSGIDPQSLLELSRDAWWGNVSEIDMQRYILNCSKGLTEPTKSDETPTVQFIHESVRDFLLKGDGFKRVFPNASANIIGSSHEALSSCCLKYIEMDKGTFLRLCSEEIASWRFPFLLYAVGQVLHHANQAASSGLAQEKLLAEFPRKVWAEQRNIFTRFHEGLLTSQVSMLYILAITGMTSLIGALPDIQSCFDVEEEHLGSPIICAMVSGNFDCAQEMLRIQAKRVPGFCYEEFHEFWSPILAISDGAKPYDNRDKVNFSRTMPKLIELIRHGGELVSIFYLQTESFSDNTGGAAGITASTVAAEKGYRHLLKELHQRGTNVAAVTSSGSTALHVAAENYGLQTMKQLVDHGADVSIADWKEQTPLHLLGLAALAEKIDPINIVRLLIDNGAHVSSRDWCGKTPLHHFSRLKYGYESAKILLDRGANITVADTDGKTPLHHWCEGDWGVRNRIFEERDPRWRDSNLGHSVLQRQASPITADYLDLGKLLLNHGAKVDVVDKFGRTPLHWCSTPEALELLVSHNACMSAVDDAGDTPLHCAVAREEIFLCQSLLQRGADSMALNKNGHTPFSSIAEVSKRNCTSLEEWVKVRIGDVQNGKGWPF